MNHRDLLKAYMKHVARCHGGEHLRFPPEVGFSDDQWTELQKLKLELFREGYSVHYHARDEIETATAWRP
jgi:hypothetical protein